MKSNRRVGCDREITIEQTERIEEYTIKKLDMGDVHVA